MLSRFLADQSLSIISAYSQALLLHAGQQATDQTKAVAGKSVSAKPKSALLRAYLDSSDEDSDAPQEQQDVKDSTQAADTKHTDNLDAAAEENVIETRSGKVLKNADASTAEDSSKSPGEDNLPQEAEDEEAREKTKTPAESPRVATQQGSSPYAPDKKLSLRERMALRGISAKK